ncbi:MAG: hypothetical protein H0X30_27380 [Anaerolineae bacterium]|nr:hypothetical protein [Anaerolineae bacterium]
MRHTLLTLGYPMGQIQQYTDAVRNDAYEDTLAEGDKYRVLDQLVSAMRSVEIAWQPVSAASPVIGKTLAEANLRTKVGTSVIALIRDKKVMPNPKSDTQFLVGDLVGLIGSAAEISEAEKILNPAS